MIVNSYEQAFTDRQYIWNTYTEAYDMSGGYVDQDDLEKLLANPTKTTAKNCLINQITYWFEVGPADPMPGWRDDPTMLDIAERYGCSESHAWNRGGIIE